ncbi:MAG: AMP-binding protein, partial [Acidimicrobiia bacterium]
MKVPLTPLDFLSRAERLYAGLEGVVDGERRFTYGEFVDRAHSLAALLRDRDVAPGDRVAFLCPNVTELLEAYFGVLLAGCVLVPLNIRLSAGEIEGILGDCSPSAVFVHPSLAQLCPGTALDDRYQDALAERSGQRVEPPPVDEDDVCELFYTSGTTGGRPKGAMLTHRNLATHALDSALTLGLHHRDVVLHTIPLFHVNGWGTPHYVTALGAKHVMLERFDPPEVFRLIEAEGVTRLSIVPTMARSLLLSEDLEKRDLSSLVQVTVGGAPPGASLLGRLEDAFGCETICGYGLTEAAPQVTKAVTLRSHDRLSPEQRRARQATTGLPNVGVDLRVLDDEDREVPWDGATAGEICIRSNHVMAGYWNQPEATEDALRGGWLRSGDLATVDAEGYVMIVDRKKDLIISGGENVSSVEVEECLCEHPSVLEAAVVGMADERWGEVPRAFVALRPGSEKVSPAELIEFVRSRLAHFKAPKRVDILDALPKGGTGKI